MYNVYMYLYCQYSVFFHMSTGLKTKTVSYNIFFSLSVYQNLVSTICGTIVEVFAFLGISWATRWLSE